MFYVSAKIGLNRNDIEKVTTITAFFESFVPSVGSQFRRQLFQF